MEPAALTTVARVILRAYQLGVHLIYVGIQGNVLELTPSLLLARDEAEEGAELIGQALEDVQNGAISEDEVAPYMMW